MKDAVGLGVKLLLSGQSQRGCSNRTVASSVVAIAKGFSPLLREKLCSSLGTRVDATVMVLEKE